VRVTVLGKSPAWQDAGGACSGYLVEEAGARLLLDCGNGVFAKLRRVCDFAEVDTVLISHLHADHFLDLVPFAYALTYAPRRGQGARPQLHAPAGAAETFRRVVGAWGNEDLIEKAFELREYHPSDRLEAGPLRIRFREVPHFTATHAVEIASRADGGHRFTFGADHGPSDALCEFAGGTDLLLIEATLPRAEEAGPRGHLTPAEAGEHGRRAQARRLVLTHFSDLLDEGWARREAEAAFGAPVELAREGAVYEI
jgi:ribonuclease BN (tRNA processing enzyme)